MDFSELYKQTSGLVQFSPNARYIASAVQFRLIIRDAETLQILHLFTCIDNISQIAWSPNSQLIACCSFKLGATQIWSLLDPEWTARVDEGVGGLRRILFAPDSINLLAFSDFKVVNAWRFLLFRIVAGDGLELDGQEC
jgi:WD40 repeat protein